MKPTILAAALILAATAADARCIADLELTRKALGKYGETPVALGISQGGNAFQLWASIDGKTWTITQTMPNGITCIMQAGTNLEIKPVPVEEVEG